MLRREVGDMQPLFLGNRLIMQGRVLDFDFQQIREALKSHPASVHLHLPDIVFADDLLMKGVITCLPFTSLPFTFPMDVNMERCSLEIVEGMDGLKTLKYNHNGGPPFSVDVITLN